MDLFIEPLTPASTAPSTQIPGFFAKSSALPNVEDEPFAVDRDTPTLQAIIDRLYTHSQTTLASTNLVIAIHGYNTGFSETMDGDGVVQGWYRPLWQYVNRDRAMQQGPPAVFLGYRWCSEQIDLRNIGPFLQALPLILQILLYGGLIGALGLLGLLFYWSIQLLVVPVILAVFLAALVVALFLLRFVVYFRDVYRAIYYGVPDLVELVRQLDQGLVQRHLEATLTVTDRWATVQRFFPQADPQNPDWQALVAQLWAALLPRQTAHLADVQVDVAAIARDLQKASELDVSREPLMALVEAVLTQQNQAYNAALRYWRDRPITLSFLGHSMGGHVTTQVVRILSDIFDSRSIGRVGSTGNKQPSGQIGRVFQLGRLVLASPDIPVVTIMSGRANFLRSSLRRFQEAHLFSNEGDLALRLASTAANYFSFPARSRAQGYRLGNVTVRPYRQPTDVKKSRAKRQQSPVYGIVNYDVLPRLPYDHLLPYLEVSVLGQAGKQTLDPALFGAMNPADVALTVPETTDAIADLFTYFDCTEYEDYTDYQPDGASRVARVLTLDRQRLPLSFWGYCRLMVAYATFSPTAFPKKGRDVHGGYFWGQFSQVLLYRLAFLGFPGLLDSLLTTAPQDLGINLTAPEDLQADLQAAQATATTLTNRQLQRYGPPSATAARTELGLLRQKRKVALRYLSWLCQAHKIQVALSPERYHVDVMGRDRAAIRLGILETETDTATTV